MKQKKVQGINMPMLRRESGEILAAHSNRLKLIEAILIVSTAVLLYAMLDQVYQLAILPALDYRMYFGRSLAIEGTYRLFRSLITLFFTLPLVSGLFHMASRMEAGEEIYLPEIFHAFSSVAAYRRACCVSWSIYWRVAILVGFEMGMESLLSLTHDTLLGILQPLLIVLMIAAPILWIVFVLGSFFRVYFAYAPTNTGKAKMLPYAASVGWHYWIGFFFWLLLSLLTVGILFLADVLPRMLIAYFRTCRHLNDTLTESEELIR